MISIIRADKTHAALLSELANQAFIESHGHSAPPADISAFGLKNYSIDAFTEELNDKANIYHIIYYNDVPAGYSKIVLDCPHPGSEVKNLGKLDRIYLLSGFYGLSLGKVLLGFNVDLAKQNQQAGIWLYVWIENQRALNFYTKSGFVINGSHDFKVSETHSNPNHQMLLKF
jgi:ribosomal protein S18 acetylase RimI-like enzyme